MEIMKVLVIGSGGREHALVWKLKQSRKVDKIFCAPGNAGIAQIAKCVSIQPDNFKSIGDFAHRNKIGLVVVGPEDPLAGGIVGGVVGNQFGGGRGKTVLTVVGALLGASIGHDYNTSHYRGRPRVENVRHCETVDRYEQEQQLVGYRVKYRYEGQTYYTRTTEHPGKFLPVRVRVSPVNGI